VSRIAERQAARFKPPYKLVVETVSGPASYTTHGDIYNSALLRQIERAAVIQGWAHLSAEVVTGSVSGNAFRMRIFTGGSTAQPAAATDLSATAFTVLLEGL